jgi:hypothetical protein
MVDFGSRDIRGGLLRLSLEKSKGLELLLRAVYTIWGFVLLLSLLPLFIILEWYSMLFLYKAIPILSVGFINPKPRPL